MMPSENLNNNVNSVKSVNKLRNNKTKHISKLKIMHWNCNSIKDKVEGLSRLLKKEKPDVFSLNEIKCNENEANDKLRFDKYIPYFKFRTNKGGGVAILIHEDIESEEIKMPEWCSAEIIGTKLKLKGRSLVIFSYYNPPNVILNKKIFEFVQENFTDYIIAGDLNAKISSLNENGNANGRALEQIIMDYNFIVLNNKKDPTSYRYLPNGDAHSVLDYFISSELPASTCEDYETVKSRALSRFEVCFFHLPIKINIILEKENKIVQKSKNESYIYTRANWMRFRTTLDEFKECNTNGSLDSASSWISQALKAAADVSIPKACKKGERIMNIPIYIRDLITLKNYWQRQYRKSRSEFSRKNLYTLKSNINNEIREFKNAQWRAFLDRIGPKPLSTVPFWKRINRLRNKKRPQTINTLEKDGFELNTDEEKATVFAEKLKATFTPVNNGRYDENHRAKIEEYVRNRKYEAN